MTVAENIGYPLKIARVPRAERTEPVRRAAEKVELGTTTIYVTHDQVEAMTLADRIVILNEARIQQTGTPAAIYAAPGNTFIAGFIDSPPMNLIPGTVAAGRFRHAGGETALPSAPDGPATLGIRPEEVAPTDGEADARGTVYSSELLGDVTLLTVAVSSHLVVAKVGHAEGRAMGAPVALRFAPDRLHVFDAATGARIPR